MILFDSSFKPDIMWISIPSSIYITLLYTLFYFFSLISWGNSYEFNLHPVFLLQKRVIRIITFSSFFKHTSPFFTSLKIMKFFDHVQFFLYQILHTNSINTSLPPFSPAFSLLPRVFMPTILDWLPNFFCSSKVSHYCWISQARQPIYSKRN